MHRKRDWMGYQILQHTRTSIKANKRQGAIPHEKGVPRTSRVYFRGEIKPKKQ
jgi:hypothetical protein